MTKLVVRWPDETWCELDELHEYSWKSDDYEVIEVFVDYGEGG
jgi:hypothetical protein